jgi:tRNA-dihydrouridine synthase C
MITEGVPALVLAPMDGVTDHLMRRLITSRMPFTYCVTEFIRISALVPPRHVFLKEVPELKSNARTVSGVPVGVQLLGGDPARLAESAALAAELGAAVIDLNFGCPAPTVNRHDGGATLLKFPERIESIVRAVRAAVPKEIPVSAKLRLGWDDPQAIYENSKRAEQGGASWITIHGRTKMQGYTPPAYWEPIGAVRRGCRIPVVANGEIWNLSDLRRCIDQSGCHHFMIGRGALADPLLAWDCARHLGLIESADPATANETRGFPLWNDLMQELISLSRQYAEADRRTVARVKQWLNYARHRGEFRWFDQVKRCQDTFELQRTLAVIAEEHLLQQNQIAPELAA